jgi:NitT/TauT family transport system substrate-binding protein
MAFIRSKMSLTTSKPAGAILIPCFGGVPMGRQSGELHQNGILKRKSIMQSRFAGAIFVAAIAVAAAPSAQAQLLPISVELGDVSLTKLPFVMAAEAGIYRRNGLDARQYITPRAAELIRQSSGVVVPKEFVGTGIGDINIGGGSPTIVRMTSDARAPQRVVLATNDPVSRFHIMSRPDITRPEDLKGKRIGFSSVGALSHYVLILWARKMGFDPVRDISLMASGMGGELIKGDRVDAFSADEIAVGEAIHQGYRDLVDTGVYKFPMPGSGVNALKDWLPNNREAATRFVKSTVDALALIRNDKEAAFAAIAKWYGIRDVRAQEQIYAQAVLLPVKPYPSVEGIKTMMEIYDYREMRIHRPEDFYDASFISELDKSGYIDGLYKK